MPENTLLFYNKNQVYELFRLKVKYRDKPVALYLYGDALSRLMKFDEAKKEFTTAIEIDSTFYPAFNARGLILSIMAEKEKNEENGQSLLSAAVKDFDDAMVLKRGFLDAKANKALILIKHGNADKTEAEFQDIIDDDPTFSIAYLGRACALEINNDLSRAAKDIVIADSLCRTAYTVFNAKKISQGNLDIEEIDVISNALPDSVYEKIRGYQSADYTVVDEQFSNMGVLESGDQAIEYSDQKILKWKEMWGNIQIFGGTAISVVGAAKMASGDLAAGIPIIKAGVDILNMGIDNRLSATIQMHSMYERKGVYFYSKTKKSWDPAGLIIEAVLNYPRISPSVVKSKEVE